MNSCSKETVVLSTLCFVFAAVAVAFLGNLWGHMPPLPSIPPTDPMFTNTATVRMSAKELMASGEDASGLDCYACHEEGKKPELKFNPEGDVILPDDHKDLTMGHGSHKRNNNCFNCHNEENLRLLQTRDGRQLELTESTSLCGSCHGPTYRDWEAGAHGRTGGLWTRAEEGFTRRDCVSCHDPHSPKFPSLVPGPAPYPLRSQSPRQTAHLGDQ